MEEPFNLYHRNENRLLPASASYLASNLSLLKIKEKVYVGTIHKGEFIIVCVSENDEVVNRVIPKLSPQQMILQGSWIWTENPLLVLTTTSAVQIFDWDGAILLHTYNSKSPRTSKGSSAFKGIIGLPSGRICIGVHSGEILVINLKDSDNLAFVEEGKFKWFSYPVIALVSQKKTIASSDAQGNIIIGTDEETLEMRKFIEPYGKDPCIACLGLLDDLVVAGYISGHIRIFNIITGIIQAEITAHAKSVLSLDISVRRTVLLSVSEDSFVRVWKINQNSETLVEHKFSECIKNCALVGCRFGDEDGTEFFVSSYDSSSLYHFVM